MLEMIPILLVVLLCIMVVVVLVRSESFPPDLDLGWYSYSLSLGFRTIQWAETWMV